jgi:hypothetical protein
MFSTVKSQKLSTSPVNPNPPPSHGATPATATLNKPPPVIIPLHRGYPHPVIFSISFCKTLNRMNTYRFTRSSSTFKPSLHRSNVSSFALILHLSIFQIDLNQWNRSNRSSIVRIQIIHSQILPNRQNQALSRKFRRCSSSLLFTGIVHMLFDFGVWNFWILSNFYFDF